jgi:Protein of unknown function (DUF1566)
MNVVGAGLFGSLTLALLIGACGGSTGSTGSPGTAGSTGSAGTASTGAGGTAGATSTAGGGAGVAGLDRNWAQWPMPNSPSDVAAGAPNPQTYTDNGDGTVTDTVTGLMWQKAVASGTFTLPQAVAFCPTLTLATHSDWRLPTIIELTSILDLGQSSLSINVTFFPATPVAAFWSSSPLAGSPTNAWVGDFSHGYTYGSDMTSPNVVRCVR